ncbi:MAG: hypothetical protein M1825_004308 [Sarcosagium campestre]|nr:MAG: hypothetical protein M1825_004308 [Sarcosagium campestre]
MPSSRVRRQSDIQRRAARRSGQTSRSESAKDKTGDASLLVRRSARISKLSTSSSAASSRPKLRESQGPYTVASLALGADPEVHRTEIERDRESIKLGQSVTLEDHPDQLSPVSASDPVTQRMPTDSSIAASQHLDHRKSRDTLGIMKILTEPPEETTAGSVLRPPFAIELRMSQTVDTHVDPTVDRQLLWGFVALMIDDGDDPAEVASKLELLGGTLVDSPHQTSENDQRLYGGDAIDGFPAPLPPEFRGTYLMFPDLRIREPGTYRIRVTLMKISDVNSGTSAVSQGALGLEDIVSRQIRVIK